nr:MAG TPA: zinc-ribbon containing domain protein [Caudoviricetes sp.]
MADYIEREVVKELLNINYGGYLDAIDRIPAADVVPVVHGRWIADGDGYHWTYNCSICAWKDGYPFNERHNFCPNCGAKMDLEEG